MQSSGAVEKSFGLRSRREKVKILSRVNLSATMLSGLWICSRWADFCFKSISVGQIFGDGQPADAFDASCLILTAPRRIWFFKLPKFVIVPNCYSSVEKTQEDLLQWRLSFDGGHIAWPMAVQLESAEIPQFLLRIWNWKAMEWEQPKSVSFSLEISNLPFASWTHDLGSVLIRVESSSRWADAARQVDGDTNTSAPLSSTPSDHFFHLSCPRLLLLWPKLLARHNLKLSYFLFWPTCRWLLPPSPSFQHLSPLLWAPWAPVWRVVGSTRTLQASLTLDGVEALLYLFNPWSQRPLKVLLLRMHRKYIGRISGNLPPPRTSLLPKSWRRWRGDRGASLRATRAAEEEEEEEGEEETEREGFLRWDAAAAASDATAAVLCAAAAVIQRWRPGEATPQPARSARAHRVGRDPGCRVSSSLF